MGDRIVIDITDGTDHTPSFYGHWCGLRAIKVLNDLVRRGEHNGIHSLMCNFVTTVLDGRPHPYPYYLYNHGEAEGAADWDNFTWTFDTSRNTWTTTYPEFRGKTLTMEAADDFVRRERPCLYRQCKCDEYGTEGCMLKYSESADSE